MFNIKNGVVMETVSYNDIGKYGFSNIYHITDEWVPNYNTPSETALEFKNYAQQYQSMMGSTFGNSDEYVNMMNVLAKSCFLGEAYCNAVKRYNQGWGIMIPDATTFFGCLRELLNDKIWAGIHQSQIEEIIEWKKAIR